MSLVDVEGPDEFLMTEWSDGDVEPVASLPDEDIQTALIYDDVLAEVTLRPRCRESTWPALLIQLLTISQGFKWTLNTACQKLELPEFPVLLRRFLYNQTYPHARVSSSFVSIEACPVFKGKISVFRNASATFRSPSDPCGPRSMRREYIRATPKWRKGHSRYDCVFVSSQPELPGLRGLLVARVFLFFSFVHMDSLYSCALIQWFSIIGNEPNDETGLWMVEPEVHEDGRPLLAVIHLDCVLRAAHLTPAYFTSDFVSRSLTMHNTLDEVKIFYVNKFVDHHAFEIAS